MLIYKTFSIFHTKTSIRFLGLFSLFVIVGLLELQASEPKKSEAELIAMLGSTNFSDVNDALDRLPDWYPNSTNAVLLIRDLLKTKETIIRVEERREGKSNVAVRRQVVVSRSEIGLPPGLLARRAARSLGDYHATLTTNELEIIYQLIRSRDVEVTQDGLKALAGLRDKNAAQHVLPLLYDSDIHVARDALRTMGAIGNKSHITVIEPFTHDLRWDVKVDARNAIASIKSRD